MRIRLQKGEGMVRDLLDGHRERSVTLPEVR